MLHNLQRSYSVSRTCNAKEVDVKQTEEIPEFPASTNSREILPDSCAFTPSGAVMERALIGVLRIFLGRWGLRQFVLMDFILDHLCFVLSPLLTSQLILFFILSFYLTQAF
jgi:hypothetical protein